MRVGAEYVGVAYVWPRTLELPSRPLKLVYLDLNHWVTLAKVLSGHSGGKNHEAILEACVQAVNDRRAVFPISDSIYFEVSKLGKHRQRRDLREAIELVSRYIVITSRSVISVHEIEAVLDEVVGPSEQPINTMNYLDWGVARAFGKVGGFRVKSLDGKDVTEEVRLRHPDGPEEFDRVLAAAELKLNRSVLDGPSSEDEVTKLRAYGWDPAVASRIAQQRADQEKDQVGRFNKEPRWRQGRIRDVVAAREAFIEINTALYEGLDSRGVSLETILPDPTHTRRLFDSMPSFDVAVTLKTAYHRDSMHRWTANDIHDIDALGSSLPYCDIVVTDKAVTSIVRSSNLSKRLRATVLFRLEDLPQYL